MLPVTKTSNNENCSLNIIARSNNEEQQEKRAEEETE
jgi:hypothetical protein